MGRNAMRHLLAGLVGVLVFAAAAPAWAASDTIQVPGIGTSITFHPFTIPSDTGCLAGPPTAPTTAAP